MGRPHSFTLPVPLVATPQTKKKQTKRQYQKKKEAAPGKEADGGKKRKRDGNDGEGEEGGLGSAYRFRGLASGPGLKKGGKPTHHGFKSKAVYKRRR